MRSLNVSIREETPTPRKRVSVSPVDETPTASATKAAPPSTMTMKEGHRDQRWRSASPDAAQLQSFSITVAPPDAERDIVNDGPVLVNGGSPAIALVSSGDSATSLGYLQSAPAGSSGGSHLSPLSDGSGTDILQRRKSYDDGVRPLDILFGKRSANQDGEDGIDRSSSGGLNVPGGPTSRSEKRRSINPGLTLDYKTSSRPSTSSGVVSPEEMVRSRTLPVQRSDSPIAPSPSKALFDLSASRRGSNASLLRDNASISTVYHSPASSPALPENGRATPESVRMRSASHDPYSSGPQSAPSLHRSTTPLRPVPRPNVTLEHVPQRSDSLSNITNTTDGLNAHGVDGRLSPVGPSTRQAVHSDGLRSTTPSPLGWNSDRSGLVTPTSPSHRADVPHGIESGTDTDAEGDSGRKSEEATRNLIDAAPLPPPKETKTKTKTKARPQDLKLDIDPDASAMSQLEGSDESSPVERTSIATFIAPALPPIRFSMSGTDFSDFLKSVGGMPSLKSLDQIAQAEEPPENSPVSTNTLTPISVAKEPPIGVNGVPAPSSGMHTSGNPPTGDIKARSLAVPDTLNVDAEANDTVSNMTREFSSRGRAASESLSPSIYGHGTEKRERLNSNASLNIVPSTTRIAITSPPDNPTTSPGVSDSYDTVIRCLQESLTDANEWGSQQLKLDKAFVETILMSLVQRRKEYTDLKHRYDGTKVRLIFINFL
jgi:hypothetical protein